MTNVVINITTVALSVPADTIVGSFLYLLRPTDTNIPALPINSADTTVTFSDVSPGDYTPSVARLDGSGQTIGAELIGASFNIPATTINVDVPATISIALV